MGDHGTVSETELIRTAVFWETAVRINFDDVDDCSNKVVESEYVTQKHQCE
jgi:hypothetical protein